MDLFGLDNLIPNLGLDPSTDQLNLLFDEFKRDFIDKTLTINGLNIKVILKNSKVEGFEDFPETFVHLITRKGQSKKRNFDRHRANKLHWVRCILENRTEEEITYFEFPEEDGTIRDYYWFKEGAFLVIMEKITPDYLVITSFHIDDQRNQLYFEKRLQWYLKNRA